MTETLGWKSVLKFAAEAALKTDTDGHTGKTPIAFVPAKNTESAHSAMEPRPALAPFKAPHPPPDGGEAQIEPPPVADRSFAQQVRGFA